MMTDQAKSTAAVPNVTEQLQLPPGFRFHPTDEELVVHYLSRRATSRPFPIPIIAEIDLYKFDPWDLPEKALFGEKEWYFFSPRDRKYPNGARPNRAAGSGYWKATGTDKPINSDAVGYHKVGVKKALVFYKGRAPRGLKTNWIMHEYRLIGDSPSKPYSTRRKGSLRLDDWVLCRIYKKSRSSQSKMVTPKIEAEEESCLEDVLASLPDIDESKLCLPRVGSLTALVEPDPLHYVGLMDHVNSFCRGEASKTGNISSLNHISELIWHKKIQDQYPAKSGHPPPVQLHSRPSQIKESMQLEDVATSIMQQQQQQQQPSSLLHSDWKHDPRSAAKQPNSHERQARLLQNTEMLPNSRTVRQERRIIGENGIKQLEDEVQSTCRSPTFSQVNQRQLPAQAPVREIHLSALPATATSSSLTCSPGLSQLSSEFLPPQMQPNCVPKLESETEFFPELNGFYVQSFS